MNSIETILQAPEDVVVRSNRELFGLSQAWFSLDDRYRYLLSRQWNEQGELMNWLMLNPSTANEQVNDPTVERCCRRAMHLGYGGVVVTNLFALRSTDPQALYQADDPVGSDNLAVILQVASLADRVVCAWGAHGERWPAHVTAVCDQLDQMCIERWCLGVTMGGQPKHPLYVAMGQALIRFNS